MKVKLALIVAIVTIFAAGSSLAMMNQPGSGWGGGMGGGTTGGGWGGGGIAPWGPGYGMNGAGGMMSGMFGRTVTNGYLDLLKPIATPQEAITSIQKFISSANSNLKISDVWEYQTVFKAELYDANGQLAFDLLVDKLTGVVTPEMGYSMMMNASWGRALQKTPKFGKHIVLTPDAATEAAQAFVSKNVSVINYTLAAPETYPGYYKFHTTDVSSGTPGMDIMVNGYNGGIWMETQLGAPINPVPVTP